MTSINGVAVSVSTAAGLTVSGVTLNGGKVNEVALGLKGGTGSDKDNVFVGTVDVTQMQADVAGKGRYSDSKYFEQQSRYGRKRYR